MLSIFSLLYLVYVSMQSITLTPAEQLNGTWHVVADRAGASRLALGSSAAQPVRRTVEDDLVVIDLAAFVKYEDFATETEMPDEVLPLDVAPRYIEPLSLEGGFEKGFSGGAKTLRWSGACKLKGKAAAAAAAFCTFITHRGHFLLTVFSDGGNSGDAGDAAIALSIIGTRVDSDPLLEDAAFNRKVKYVMLIMLGVAVIHYALSAFAPPTQKQIRRDARVGRFMELQRQREAAAEAAEAAKK